MSATHFQKEISLIVIDAYFIVEVYSIPDGCTFINSCSIINLCFIGPIANLAVYFKGIFDSQFRPFHIFSYIE